MVKIFGPKKIWVKKIRTSKIRSKSLVKIGSITAEIFLIRTLAARTNVAMPNVTTAVSIC